GHPTSLAGVLSAYRSFLLGDARRLSCRASGERLTSARAPSLGQIPLIAARDQGHATDSSPRLSSADVEAALEALLALVDGALPEELTSAEKRDRERGPLARLQVRRLLAEDREVVHLLAGVPDDELSNLAALDVV